jgi:hypothetical protein
MMTWIEALRKWNSSKKTWCIPKKGTREYEEVLAIQREGSKSVKSLIKSIEKKKKSK